MCPSIVLDRSLIFVCSVTRAQRKNLLELADDPTKFHLGYHLVPVFEHIPIFSLEKLCLNELSTLHEDTEDDELNRENEEFWTTDRLEIPDSRDTMASRAVDSEGRRDGVLLRDAAIQGNFELVRRDYLGIFSDLEAELHGPSIFHLSFETPAESLFCHVSAADPASWGYGLNLHSKIFKPINKDAFILHLIGNGEAGFIPNALKEVVVVHKGLSYQYFFALMNRM